MEVDHKTEFILPIYSYLKARRKLATKRSDIIISTALTVAKPSGLEEEKQRPQVLREGNKRLIHVLQDKMEYTRLTREIKGFIIREGCTEAKKCETE